MVKRIILGVVFGLVVLSMYVLSFAAADNQPLIELDGAEITGCAHIRDGNIYLPLRAVGEALGYSVGWSGNDSDIILSKAGREVAVNIKSNRINSNGHVYYMDWGRSGSGVDNGMAIGDTTFIGKDFFSDNFGVRVVLDKEAGKVSVVGIKENPVSIKTVKKSSEDDKLKVTLQFPQIEGLEDIAVQDRINLKFSGAAEKALNEGLKNAGNMAQESDGYTGRQYKCETYFDYRVKYNQNGFLSIIFLNYQYTGGAHGGTIQSSLTYNLKTGQEYMLADLFTEGADYVSLMNGVITEEINERIKAELLPEYSISPFRTIRNDQDFYLADGAVAVYFQQYEYFPYAAGIQAFPVEFSVLKDILKPEFSFLVKGARPETPSPGGPVSGKESFFNSRVAYAAEDGLYCTGLEEGNAVLLVRGTGISSPVFSRDGSAVAYVQGGALYAYVFEESGRKLLLEGVESYCPGGKDEFYASSKKMGIASINFRTLEAASVVSGEKNASFRNLKVSPDFKYLAYDMTLLDGNNRFEDGGTWLYDIGIKEARLIMKAEKPDNTSLGTLPTAGKWSPDSGKLLVWVKTHSASLNADGVSAAVYDLAGNKLIMLEDGGLAYDENVSFKDPDTLVMISGGSRMMSERKTLRLFDTKSGKALAFRNMQESAAAMPFYSSDGRSLVFAASPVAVKGEDFKTQMSTISERRIYVYRDGKAAALTGEGSFRSEFPVFLKNSDYIIFVRIGPEGEKSIWRMDGGGENQKQIASWKYSDNNDFRDLDFYGRVDWNRMIAVWDNTREN